MTNQAIQVLQGPYITNTYGGGIQCQGPTVNFTPFVTGSLSQQHPYEPIYQDPVYDMRDLDEDGSLDNPGDILYYVPTRTGQKNNTNFTAFNKLYLKFFLILGAKMASFFHLFFISSKDLNSPA